MRLGFRVASHRPLLVAAFLVFPPLASGQFGNTIVGVGNLSDFTNVVAPGSIVNLLVTGIGSTLTGPVKATGFPLPNTLAGISVTLTQYSSTPGQVLSLPVPLLEVTPGPTCTSQSMLPSCGSFVQLTVQIPFEMAPVVEFDTRLVVSENGVAGAATGLDPTLAKVHVVAITHSDGTAVVAGHPARSGEELAIWAYGLGATTPAVPGGQATPSPAPVTQSTPSLNFDFRPNAAPSRPYCASLLNCPKTTPDFAGLAPGFASLYQVNFSVSPPPPGTPPCNTIAVGSPNSVASNLTVTLIGPASSSVDGAGICVDTSGLPPTVQITNTTRGGSSAFYAGDTWTLSIAGGAARAAVLVNGAYSVGQTDDSGNFSLTGSMSVNQVGPWVEIWTVGGQTAVPSPLMFYVYPSSGN